MRFHLAASRAVDGFAVLLEPFSDFAESADGLFGQLSAGLGSDVEQQVGIASGGSHEQVDELARRLVS